MRNETGQLVANQRYMASYKLACFTSTQVMVLRQAQALNLRQFFPHIILSLVFLELDKGRVEGKEGDFADKGTSVRMPRHARHDGETGSMF